MIFANTASGTQAAVYLQAVNGSNTISMPGTVRATNIEYAPSGDATVQVEYDLWPQTWGTADEATGWVVRHARGTGDSWVQVRWDRVTNDTNCLHCADTHEWGWVGTNTTSATARYTARVLYRVGAGQGWYEACPGGFVYATKTPEERLKEILQARQAPAIIGSRKSIQVTADERERRARDTLRRVLGESKFRTFIKQGFVSVKAKSGKVYQIFPGNGITCVYDQGQMVERLCVVLTGNFPPTDSLIMRYILILNNEEMFRSKAVKHGVGQYTNDAVQAVDDRPLPEIFAELKGRGAIAIGRTASKPAVEKVA